MASLMQLARSRFPLPLAGVHARRSLLAVENLSAAVATVLTAAGPLRRAFIVADREALTVAEIIAAMRHGLGRKPNVFPLPTALLELLLRVMGGKEVYQRIARPLVVDSAALLSFNWTPPLTTPIGLARLMQ